MTAGTLEPAPADPRPGTRLRWWHELLMIAAFYGLYSVVRNIGGSTPVSKAHATANADRVIRLERFFHLFQEQRIQAWFLHSHLVVSFLNDFYGTAHFVVTAFALLFLFRWHPSRYPLWRNTLAITSTLALVGFAFFPLLPPRLLPLNFHFVDTLETIGGLWSFESGPVTAVSNQYAAMPSLHFAWSLWCALAMAPAVKHRWVKIGVFCYPVVTLMCIIATANHFIADAIAGALILLAGFGLALLVQRARGVSRSDRAPAGRTG